MEAKRKTLPKPCWCLVRLGSSSIIIKPNHDDHDGHADQVAFYLRQSHGSSHGQISSPADSHAQISSPADSCSWLPCPCPVKCCRRLPGPVRAQISSPATTVRIICPVKYCRRLPGPVRATLFLHRWQSQHVHSMSTACQGPKSGIKSLGASYQLPHSQIAAAGCRPRTDSGGVVLFHQRRF